MLRHATLALALLLSLPAALPAANAQPTSTRYGLSEQISEVLDAGVFASAFWGAKVVNLSTGETLFERNADRRFIPASNMKLLTTASVLDALGPDFRYTTRLYADGQRRGSTLEGSLVVRGSGDPTFGGRYTGGDLTQVFRQWADSLQASGIRRVTGSVVGDDDVFDNVGLGEGWSWDDLVWAYAAETSGLQFNEGTIEMTVRGTSAGRPAAISIEPAAGAGYVTVSNQTVTTDGGAVREGYARNLGANAFTVTTTVPAGETETEALAVVNPTEYFVRTLVAVLRQRGIEIDGDAVDVDEWSQSPRYDRMERVALHQSPPLSAIAGQTNTDSNNLYAEHLLRTLGAFRYRGAEYAVGSAQAGAAAAEPFLRRIGVEPYDLRIADGSGLSALNRLTPNAIIAILKAMEEHPDRRTRDAFYRSLAVGGLTGTIKGRYRAGDARGNVHAKTGYISGARTLSGYVTSERGDLIAFSLLCNHYATATSRVNEAQDQIVEMLADYQGR